MVRNTTSRTIRLPSLHKIRPGINGGLTDTILNRPENEAAVFALMQSGAIVIGPKAKAPTEPPQVPVSAPAPRINLTKPLTRRMLAAAAPADVLALAEMHKVEAMPGTPIDDVRLAIAERVFE